MNHHGGCQCGAVRYEAQVDLEKAVIDCNCSICGKQGLLLTFIPAADFKLISGEDNLTEHRFNKEKIGHYFCKTCGVESYGTGKGPNGDEMIALNVRTLDDIQLSQLITMPFDGKSL